MTALHPEDQAAGLRQLFAAARTRFVPVVSNPHVEIGSLLLERLALACNEAGSHALVVDAGELAPAPHEIAALEPAAAIEHLSPKLSYLAARGLPIAYVDAQGSTAGFLHTLAEAVPPGSVVLVHASASELARLFGRRNVRCLLLASDHPDSVTHAYASLKVLARRAGLMAFDLLLSAAPGSPRADRIAHHLGRCADDFVGAALHASARLDPSSPLGAPTPAAFGALVRALLQACEAAPAAARAPVAATPWADSDHAPGWPAAAAHVQTAYARATH